MSNLKINKKKDSDIWVTPNSNTHPHTACVHTDLQRAEEEEALTCPTQTSLDIFVGFLQVWVALQAVWRLSHWCLQGTLHPRGKTEGWTWTGVKDPFSYTCSAINAVDFQTDASLFWATMWRQQVERPSLCVHDLFSASTSAILFLCFDLHWVWFNWWVPSDIRASWTHGSQHDDVWRTHIIFRTTITNNAWRYMLNRAEIHLVWSLLSPQIPLVLVLSVSMPAVRINKAINV